MKTNILILIIILFASQAWGATYYLQSGGNDSAAGTSDATAWAYCPGMADWTGSANLSSGDTVYFRSQDTWFASSGQVLNATTAGVTFDGSTYGSGTRATLQATGSLNAVVKLSASNLTFKGFDIDMNEQTTGGIYVGSYATADVSNIAVDNCIIHDSDIPEIYGDNSAFNYGIHVGGYAAAYVDVSNVTIKDSQVYNTFHEGIAIYPTWTKDGCTASYVTVQRCIVHNYGQDGGSWGTGIMVVNNADNIIIEFNTVYNGNRGITCGTSGSSNVGTPQNATYRYNLIHDNSYGFFINYSQNTTFDATADFYNNIILNSNSSDINVSNGGSGNYGKTALNFYNNTIYNSSGSYPRSVQIAKFSTLGGSPTFNFKNNIVYFGVNTSEYAIDDSKSLLTHSNNLIFRPLFVSQNAVRDGASTYTVENVKNWEATAQNTDPNFTGGTLPTGFTGTYGIDMVPNTHYFSIESGNALDNGATLETPYNGCINGAGLANSFLRISGKYDIGAYENEPNSVPTAPRNLRLVTP